MRINRQLMVMAGVQATPMDRAIKRQERAIIKHRRMVQKEALLVDMISRRERGEGGTAPMPYKQLQDTLAKIAKGDL